ncbi:AsmA family protein [Erwinia sp. CPCC 100877]|nr:AsmA family protein [Erwinia sp. CPCC 100877]
MTRLGKTGLGVVVAIVVLGVGLVAFIATFDWNRLRPVINDKVSSELQRPFEIRGDLSVAWVRHPEEPGWRRWVPWPQVTARDVMLGNPPDIPDKTMVLLPKVEATLSPAALLTKTVWLPWLRLVQPDVRLIRLSEKHYNWRFEQGNESSKDKKPPSAWSFRLDNILFDRGRITVDDRVTKAQMTVMVDPLGKPLAFSEVTGSGKSGAAKVGDYVFGLRINGRYKGQDIAGRGKIGGMLALRSEGTPFPLQADVRAGQSRLAVSGTISNPMAFGGADLRLRLSGDSLGDLYALTGVLLPDSPPYETDGHLVVHSGGKEGNRFDYKDFNGRIGASDIHGSLTYHQSQPRPKLEGELVSRQLRLADLGPLIGVESGGAKPRPGQEVQPSDKVLPRDRFETDKWGVMDADVRFKGQRIEHGSTLPLRDLKVQLSLRDGDLRLTPLSFGMAGGDIDADIHLRGNRQPMQGEARIKARRLQLKQLMPNIQEMQKTLGELNGDASLRGSGNSVAALLGSSSGNLKLLMNDGLISRNLMEILGLNVGNYVVGQIFGDEEVRVNCAAAGLRLTNGLVRPDIFAFDTENALVNITGNVNLASERLDLTITPESKGIRIITLRSPLYVRSTFKSPDAGVKPGPLIARGAVATALATLVTPAAALLALVSPSEGGADNQCRTILSQLGK